jgi:dTDP-4-dehydrorhamnose reductase
MINNKTQILVTGSTGLVGSKLLQMFREQYELVGVDRSDEQDPVDITDLTQIQRKFEKHADAQYVVHLAAYTDVTGAWKQNGQKDGLAYQVNVEGTKNLIRACEESNKHLIHISTAYVFDGSKEEMYVEDDVTNPIEWYGQTKLWAEEAVLESDIKSIILRIDQPFRDDEYPKVDVVHRIIKGLQENNLYPQFGNHFFGPTYINDFAKVIEWVWRTGTTGVFHASSGEMWNDFDFAQKINQVLSLEGEVKEGDLNEYLKTLNRPYQRNTAMDSSKLKSALDFELKSVEQALGEIKLA